MKKIVFAGMLLFGLLLWLAGAEAEMRPKRVLLLRDFDANYRWPTLLSDRILDYYREEPEARARSSHRFRSEAGIRSRESSSGSWCSMT